MRANVTAGLIGASKAIWGATADAAFAAVMAQTITEASNNAIEIDSSGIDVVSVEDVINLLATRRLEPGEICDRHEKYQSVCSDDSSQASRRVALESLTVADETRRVLQQSGVAVTFTLTVTTQQVGNSNPAAAFALVTSALTRAVGSGGTLTANLAAAATSGVSAFTRVSASSAAPLVTSPIFTVLHSAKPTGTPTGQPTMIECPAGHYHSSDSPSCLACPAGYSSLAGSYECSKCAPGSITAAPGTATCSVCGLGTYAEAALLTTCKRCPWPTTTAFVASSNCEAIAIALTFEQLVVFGVLALTVYGVCCVLTRKPEFVVFTVFPMLDIVSDLLYLLQNTFYSKVLFGMCILFIVLPNTFFLRLANDMGALVPHILLPVPAFLEDGTLLWLGNNHGFPLFRGQRLSVSFDKHDGILKVVWFWVVWAVCLAAQSVSLSVFLACYAPFIAFHVTFSALWLAFGFFLYQIKVMAVGSVWTFWFRVWRRRDGDKHDSKVLVDTGIMNESLLAEFVSETCPQLIIQSLNSALCGTLNNSTAQFSIFLSVFMACNGIYRYWYYTYYLGYDYKDVPLEMTTPWGSRITLEHATHRHGRDKTGPDLKNLPDADVQVLSVENDSRFRKIVALLDDVAFVRDANKYPPSRVHLFGRNCPLTIQRIEESRKQQLQLMLGQGKDTAAVVLRKEKHPGDLEQSDSEGEGEKGHEKGHEKTLAETSCDEERGLPEALSTSPDPDPQLSRSTLRLNAACSSVHSVQLWASHVSPRDPRATLGANAQFARLRGSSSQDNKSGDGDSVSDGGGADGGGEGGKDDASEDEGSGEPLVSLSWLDPLDVAVAEYGFSDLPVLNDLFVWLVVRALKRRGIVSERTLHTALKPFAAAASSSAPAPASTTVALVGIVGTPHPLDSLTASIGLGDAFLRLVLRSFWIASWRRFEQLGKGIDYVWPDADSDSDKGGQSSELDADAIACGFNAIPDSDSPSSTHQNP